MGEVVNLFRFIFDAFLYGVAYIDCDGTILRKMPVPDEVQDKLSWWRVNLAPTPIIKKRLLLLYLLCLLDVDLILWTNRDPEHERVTRMALGKHARVFMEMRFYSGRKRVESSPSGPVMDDDEVNLIGKGYNLLVEGL